MNLAELDLAKEAREEEAKRASQRINQKVFAGEINAHEENFQSYEEKTNNAKVEMGKKISLFENGEKDSSKVLEKFTKGLEGLDSYALEEEKDHRTISEENEGLVLKNSQLEEAEKISKDDASSNRGRLFSIRNAIEKVHDSFKESLDAKVQVETNQVLQNAEAMDDLKEKASNFLDKANKEKIAVNISSSSLTTIVSILPIPAVAKTLINFGVGGAKTFVEEHFHQKSIKEDLAKKEERDLDQSLNLGDLREKTEGNISELETLKEEIKALKGENLSLKGENDALKGKIDSLSNAINDYEDRFEKIEKILERKYNLKESVPLGE